MQANPAVNRYLSDKDMDRIDHALGRPVWPLRESYRNNFATAAGGALASEFSSSTYWDWVAQSREMAFFRVTDAGRRALADYLAGIAEPWRAFALTYEGHTSIVPAKTPGKAKYSHYLTVSDLRPELSFGEFCQAVTVRCAT